MLGSGLCSQAGKPGKRLHALLLQLTSTSAVVTAGRHAGQWSVQPGGQVGQAAAQRHTHGQRLLWGRQVRDTGGWVCTSVCTSVPVIMGVAEQILIQRVLLVVRMLSLCHI
jgi:hypothetical protein